MAKRTNVAGIEKLLDWMKSEKLTQTETASQLTEVAANLGSKRKLTVHYLNHVVRLRRAPNLLFACAVEKLVGIDAVDWIRA